ncbi:MAG: endonuclease/exonuclease/phosphatase family protein [Flaviflexus sp.]|nr:endonuclease/exonuclease/phosphatase family protein [Flaviflexus sp.]
MADLRIATINFQHGHPAERLDTALRQIGHLNADVLLMQEMDNGLARSEFAHQARIVAARADMEHFALVPSRSRITTILRGRAPSTSIGDLGSGIAICSRHPLLSVTPYDLPTTRSLVLWKNWRPHIDQPRQLLVARLATPAGEVTVACTHLSWQWGQAEVQMRRVEKILATWPGPRLLGGDFNRRESPSSLPVLARAHTFPAENPDRQIDYLVGDLIPVRSWTVRLAVSDHLALVADLDLPEV